MMSSIGTSEISESSPGHCAFRMNLVCDFCTLIILYSKRFAVGPTASVWFRSTSSHAR